MLRKSLGFTAVAVSHSRLALGRNAAIFGFGGLCILAQLTFREPEWIIHTWTIETDGHLHTPTPTISRHAGKAISRLSKCGRLGGRLTFTTPMVRLAKLAALLWNSETGYPTLGVQPSPQLS